MSKMRNYDGPIGNKNPIKYYANEEKRTCTAVLEFIPWDMMKIARSFAKKNGLFYFSCEEMDEFIEGIPDRIAAVARCSEQDEFDEEFGCALARARALKKLYFYRDKMMTRIAVYFDKLSNKACKDAYHYNRRASDYANEEEAIISSDKI